MLLSVSNNNMYTLKRQAVIYKQTSIIRSKQTCIINVFGHVRLKHMQVKTERNKK